MKRIVIIEDNDLLLSTLKELFEINDFEVATASNGLDGIQLIKSFNPDVVLCDVVLPDISGYEIYKKVNICFLFLTANYSDDWKDIELIHHLQKPVGIKGLVEKINAIIGLMNEV